MRAVAYWPKQELHFTVGKHDDGTPSLEADWINYSKLIKEEGEDAARVIRDSRIRTVFWVLATREEAEEYIVPHMVNEVLYWKEVLRMPRNLQEDDTIWSYTDEFSFFVPQVSRLRDAPTVCSRVFPYSAMQSNKPWHIGEADKHTYTAKGIEIPNIEAYTFEGLIDQLNSEGRWHPENRPHHMDVARQKKETEAQ